MEKAFNYEEEAAVTMNEDFHGALVCERAARLFLDEAISALTALDRVKKSLFYGREYMHLMNGVDVFGGADSLLANFENRKMGEHILHAILGIATETGELLEALRNTIVNGEPLNVTNLFEECGDLFWYIAILSREFSYNHEVIQRGNISKLRQRYPNAFCEFDANNRNIDAEQKRLENIFGLGK